MKVFAMWTAAFLFAAAGSARADDYGKWGKNETGKTYACDYTYSNKDNGKSKQTVVVFYGDNDRAGWAYYYNADQKPWARCAVPGNPKYKEKQMYWEALKPDGTGYAPFKDKNGKEYEAGYCPTPKDGKNPIPDLPLPPK